MIEILEAQKVPTISRISGKCPICGHDLRTPKSSVCKSCYDTIIRAVYDNITNEPRRGIPYEALKKAMGYKGNFKAAFNREKNDNGYQLHHKDGNKSNGNPSNLVLVPSDDHRKFHAKKFYEILSTAINKCYGRSKKNIGSIDKFIELVSDWVDRHSKLKNYFNKYKTIEDIINNPPKDIKQLFTKNYLTK